MQTYEDAMISCDVWAEFVCVDCYNTMRITLCTLERCSEIAQKHFAATRERNLLLTSKLPRKKGN